MNNGNMEKNRRPGISVGAIAMWALVVAAGAPAAAQAVESPVISSGAALTTDGSVFVVGISPIGVALGSAEIHQGPIPCWAGNDEGLLPGDTNCDGAVTVSDIGPFVMALTAPSQYQQQFPDCDLLSADVNDDGAVTVSDIGPFVNLLTGL